MGIESSSPPSSVGFNDTINNLNAFTNLPCLWDVFASITILILLCICIKTLKKRDISFKDMCRVEYLKTVLRFLVVSLFGSWIVLFTLAICWNSFNIIHSLPINQLSETEKDIFEINLKPVYYASYIFFFSTLILAFVETVFAEKLTVVKCRTASHPSVGVQGLPPPH